MDDGAGHVNAPNQTDLASRLVFRAVLFASRQIWRACSSHLNQTCMREDLLPILRGGIEFYMRAPSDLNGTLTPRGPVHRAVYHDTAGKMHLRMPSYSLVRPKSLPARWCSRVLLMRGLRSFGGRGRSFSISCSRTSVSRVAISPSAKAATDPSSCCLCRTPRPARAL